MAKVQMHLGERFHRFPVQNAQPVSIPWQTWQNTLSMTVQRTARFEEMPTCVILEKLFRETEPVKDRDHLGPQKFWDRIWEENHDWCEMGRTIGTEATGEMTLFDPDVFGPTAEAKPKFAFRSFTCPACGAEFSSSAARSMHMADACADQILDAVDEGEWGA